MEGEIMPPTSDVASEAPLGMDEGHMPAARQDSSEASKAPETDQDRPQSRGDEIAPDLPGGGRATTLAGEGEWSAAVSLLTQIALEMDDPVQALEDGAEALAEALVSREQEARQAEQVAQTQRRTREADLAERQGAYRHARLHRVGELVDVGYSLDQAVAITNGNEADVRQRALAAGEDPDHVIFDYAVRHGYRPRPRDGAGRVEPASIPRPKMNGTLSMMERLAALGDDEFAEATRGDRWQRMLKGG